MSTVQLAGATGAARTDPVEAVHTRWLNLPLAIGVALLVLIVDAAFEHGGVAPAAGSRIEIAVAAIAAVAVGGWLWSRTLRAAAPRIGAVGVLLLAAFACWSGITALWSVAPDQTWIELNRAI